MAAISPRILILSTFDPDFLRDIYRENPALAGLDYSEQRQRLFQTGFGLSDAYGACLQTHGWDAWDIIINAGPLQRRWAIEKGLDVPEDLYERRRRIVSAQVADHQPDVLFVFEWCPLGDAFLLEIKDHTRLVVGQVASTLPRNRTYAGYDLMFSSLKPIVEYFRTQSKAAEYLPLGFDARIREPLGSPLPPPEYDVTFVGGLGASHVDRIAWLELLAREVNVDIFGYGLENVAPDSPIRSRHHGPVWGLRQYEVLRRSRLTLNLHAHVDVRGIQATQAAANNMRLYEATGVGTCLLTDWKENLGELFRPGEEVVTFTNPTHCVEQVRGLLADDDRRASIARAGRDRTLREHTYLSRMADLAHILEHHVQIT